ncbi:hypothetical protein VD659_04515 [Herbiconiux sp. 11R-BC]|uniref:hypothetical protein n=1 Tax=Herbiconiux sp. 11R-BC TaxID=3111637 RepID=UPI003C0BB74B
MSTTSWRFFQPRKPPKLPPKGEPWGGLLRPATFVTLGIVLAVVAAVWIGVATARSDAPTTLDGVTAEVMVEVDAVTAALADPGAVPADSTAVVPCPAGGAGQQYTITRTVPLRPGVSGADALAGIRSDYESRGWKVSTSSFGGQGGVQSELIGLNLVPVTVTITSADEPLSLRIESASRCTAP